MNNLVFDNFVPELAQSSRDLGFTEHKIVPIPDVVTPNTNRFYSSSISQMYSTSHIWMTIDELSSMPYWNIISTFNLPRNVFARIQMATDILHWVFWSQGIEEFKRECGSGEKCSLSQLTIGWLDQNGDVTDFHGMDHSLVLRVTCSPPE